MEKVSPKVAKVLREKMFDLLKSKGIEIVQISGSAYGCEIEYDGEFYRTELHCKIPNDQEFTSLDLNEEFLKKEKEKEQKQKEKEEQKKKKIERDKKLREQKKKEKGQ